MNSKAQILEAAQRMLWAEKEMKALYSQYSQFLKDESILKIIKEIETDEAMHVNMAERVISILGQ